MFRFRFPNRFLSTLRSNLDPFGLYDDVHLWDTLKRAHLADMEENQPSSPKTTSEGDAQAVGGRFDLDTPIEGEGNNLSVGQVTFSPVFHLFLVIDCRKAITSIPGTSLSP